MSGGVFACPRMPLAYFTHFYAHVCEIRSYLIILPWQSSIHLLTEPLCSVSTHFLHLQWIYCRIARYISYKIKNIMLYIQVMIPCHSLRVLLLKKDCYHRYTRPYPQWFKCPIGNNSLKPDIFPFCLTWWSSMCISVSLLRDKGFGENAWRPLGMRGHVLSQRDPLSTTTKPAEIYCMKTITKHSAHNKPYKWQNFQK